MLTKLRLVVMLLLGAALLAGAVGAADLTDSLQKGTPDLKSAGPLAFGADGVLFVGDPQGAAIFAIDTGDKGGASPPTGALKVEKIDEKVAALLGTTAKDILINHVAVNPASGNAYLSVSRGKGPAGTPVLLRIDRKGKIDEVSLKGVKFAKAALPNASDKSRQEAITCIAYVKGKVFVAGLSNEEFSSTLRAIPFPFKEADKGSGIEIYHASHNKVETKSPVRTFVAYDINGETNLLAAYTCTPLVKIPVSELKPGQKVKGTTIAELGNRNRPLDMIVYSKGGKDYILLANNSRGVMKIPTEGMDKAEAITKAVKDTAGVKYDTIKEWQGVLHIDKLDKENALILVQGKDGQMNLETVPLP